MAGFSIYRFGILQQQQVELAREVYGQETASRILIT